MRLGNLSNTPAASAPPAADSRSRSTEPWSLEVSRALGRDPAGKGVPRARARKWSAGRMQQGASSRVSVPGPAKGEMIAPFQSKYSRVKKFVKCR